MQDYNFQVPDNRIIGCAADCGDQTYPDPTPGSDPLTPIPSGTWTRNAVRAHSLVSEASQVLRRGWRLSRAIELCDWVMRVSLEYTRKILTFNNVLPHPCLSPVWECNIWTAFYLYFIFRQQKSSVPLAMVQYRKGAAIQIPTQLWASTHRCRRPMLMRSAAIGSGGPSLRPFQSER